MSTFKKLISILFGFICIFVCVVTLLFYFAFKPIEASEQAPITIEDMVIEQGRKQEIEYKISDQSFQVEFTVSDQSVAYLVNNKEVFANSVGVTYLKVLVTKGDFSYSAYSQIKVIKKQEADLPPIDDQPSYEMQRYYYVITPMQNCSYKNSKLTIDKLGSFSLTLYINKAMTLIKEYSDVEISCSEGIKCDREVNNFVVTVENNGKIYLNFPCLEYDITIDVVLK